MIFKIFLRNGKLPMGWKLANVVSTDNEMNKQSVTKCRPVSLPPSHLCKSISKLALSYYNICFPVKNILFSKTRRPLHWSISTDSSWSIFYMGHKVGGIFHDIAKVFEKVWYDRLIIKLHQNNICVEKFWYSDLIMKLP